MSNSSEYTPVYLADSKVSKYLDGQWDLILKAVENALRSFSCKEVIQPVRSSISIDAHDGTLLTMPGYSIKEDALASKLVTIYPKNSDIALPSIQATVLLYAAENGRLQAIMDGHTITGMRTAAASAVATKFLAKKEPQILAILGSGEQARTHYRVLTHIYKSIKKICVWNIHKESAMKFVSEIQKDYYTATCYDTVEDAVKGADIIVTATLSQKPILQKDWVKPGAHINAVGAASPTWQELSEDLVLSSVVYADSKEAAIVESGDIIKSGAKVFAEIGEVIAGTKEAFPEKTTIFKSLGMAIEDVVTAKLVYEMFEKDEEK